MTLQSIYTGEGYGNNPSNFIYVVSWWAEQRNLPGLHAWIKRFSSYSSFDQAQILIDWIDKYCSFDEVNNCIQVLTEMNEDLYYDSDGYVEDDDQIERERKEIEDDERY